MRKYTGLCKEPERLNKYIPLSEACLIDVAMRASTGEASTIVQEIVSVESGLYWDYSWMEQCLCLEDITTISKLLPGHLRRLDEDLANTICDNLVEAHEDARIHSQTT